MRRANNWRTLSLFKDCIFIFKLTAVENIITNNEYRAEIKSRGCSGLSMFSTIHKSIILNHFHPWILLGMDTGPVWSRISETVTVAIGYLTDVPCTPVDTTHAAGQRRWWGIPSESERCGGLLCSWWLWISQYVKTLTCGPCVAIPCTRLMDQGIWHCEQLCESGCGAVKNGKWEACLQSADRILDSDLMSEPHGVFAPTNSFISSVLLRFPDKGGSCMVVAGQGKVSSRFQGWPNCSWCLCQAS